MLIPIEPLEPGAPFPEISSVHTDQWVDWWNIVWKSWIENKVSGEGSGISGWPTPLTKNGKILQIENDGLDIRKTSTPSLSILIPEGWEGIVNGEYILTEADTVVGTVSQNFDGWISLSREYDEDFEIWNWELEEHLTRPELGYGVSAKVKAGSDRIIDLFSDELNSDIIISLPLLYQRIRNIATPSGVVTIYLTDTKWSLADPRPSTVVIEEKISQALESALNAVEAGGDREAETESDQLWNTMLGMARPIREADPNSLRFINIGSARPGIQGTLSAPDTELFDRGGTIPENTEQRNYDSR